MPAVETSQIPSRADEPQTTLQKALLSLISNRHDSLSEAVTSSNKQAKQRHRKLLLMHQLFQRIRHLEDIIYRQLTPKAASSSNI